MLEPTETESVETLDSFAEAMQAIAREAAEQPRAAQGGAARNSGGPPGRSQGRQARHRALPLRRASRSLGRAGRCGRRGAQGRVMIDLRSDTQPSRRPRCAPRSRGGGRRRAEARGPDRQRAGATRRPSCSARRRRSSCRRRRWRTRSRCASSAARATRCRGGELAHLHLGARRPGGSRGPDDAAAALRGRTLHAKQLRETVRVTDGTHVPPTKIVSVENTHNASGGRVWPLEEIERDRRNGPRARAAVHLDGARVMNASVAIGVPSATIGRPFDTVTLCLSKGLGCPLGALVAGSPELMARGSPPEAPLRRRHAASGNRRRGGVYALEHNVERLADDHARARRLAEGLHGPAYRSTSSRSRRTSFRSSSAPLGCRRRRRIARLADAGVGLSMTGIPASSAPSRTSISTTRHRAGDRADSARSGRPCPRLRSASLVSSARPSAKAACQAFRPPCPGR